MKIVLKIHVLMNGKVLKLFSTSCYGYNVLVIASIIFGQ